MKEKDWDECIESSSSISITPNKFKARSLVKIAKGRIEFLGKIKLEENNAGYVFEGYYSSLVEMMHALVLLKGFKVGNHICLGYYLRDIIEKEDLFRLFDDCRYKRNSLVYYGQNISLEVATNAIDKCVKLIGEVEQML